MPRLYGVYRSRATRPLWLAAEAGLHLDFVPVVQGYRLTAPLAADAPLNTQSPKFLTLCLQGTIPVYQDGDLVLAESMAILLHLARDAGDLGPKDAAETAQMMQWAFHALTAIEPHALEIVYAKDANAVCMKEAAKALKRPLAVLDKHLEADNYLVGNRFTAADIAVAECLRYAQGRTGLIEGFTNVCNWLNICQARPAFVTLMKMRVAEPEDPNPPA